MKRAGNLPPGHNALHVLCVYDLVSVKNETGKVVGELIIFNEHNSMEPLCMKEFFTK